MHVDGVYTIPVNGRYVNDQLRYDAGDYTMDPLTVVSISDVIHLTCYTL